LTSHEDEDARQAEFDRNADEAAGGVRDGCFQGCLVLPSGVGGLVIALPLVG
jgi:hypothetical protein